MQFNMEIGHGTRDDWSNFVFAVIQLAYEDHHNQVEWTGNINNFHRNIALEILTPECYNRECRAFQNDFAIDLYLTTRRSLYYMDREEPTIKPKEFQLP